MSWLGLNHFVTVKAALGRQAAAARFLEAGGRRSFVRADDSVDMGSDSDAYETAPVVFHILYEDAAGRWRRRRSL